MTLILHTREVSIHINYNVGVTVQGLVLGGAAFNECFVRLWAVVAIFGKARPSKPRNHLDNTVLRASTPSLPKP
jgi:hypothetical protein